MVVETSVKMLKAVDNTCPLQSRFLFFLPSNLSPHLFARRAYKSVFGSSVLRSTTLIPNRVEYTKHLFPINIRKKTARPFAIQRISFRIHPLSNCLMIIFGYLQSGCMRFETIKCGIRKIRRIEGATLADRKRPVEVGRRDIISKKKFAELLFENCIDCGRMAAIPQGAFVAYKVRRNLERNTLITPIQETEKLGKENIFNIRPPVEGWELTPLKYNSKLMNSIWGLYNRYSVHNFKKNTDAEEGALGVFAAVFEAVFESHASAADRVAASTVTSKS